MHSIPPSRLASRTISPAPGDSASLPRARIDRKDSTWSMLSANPSTEGNRSPNAAPSPRLGPDDSISEAGDDHTIGRGSVAGPHAVRPVTSARADRQASFASFRNGSFVAGSSAAGVSRGGDLSRDSRREMEAIWHQVFDPALEYCEVNVGSDVGRGSQLTIDVFLAHRHSSSPLPNPLLRHRRYHC